MQNTTLLQSSEGSAVATDCLSGAQGVVNMHLPERWAVLQFAGGAPGGAQPRPDPDWTLRTVAMGVYDAQRAHAAARNGTFARDAATLVPFAPARLIDGTCTAVPKLTLGADGRCWWAAVGGRHRLGAAGLAPGLAGLGQGLGAGGQEGHMLAAGGPLMEADVGEGAQRTACISYDRYLRVVPNGLTCERFWSPC